MPTTRSGSWSLSFPMIFDRLPVAVIFQRARVAFALYIARCVALADKQQNGIALLIGAYRQVVALKGHLYHGRGRKGLRQLFDQCLA